MVPARLPRDRATTSGKNTSHGARSPPATTMPITRHATAAPTKKNATRSRCPRRTWGVPAAARPAMPACSAHPKPTATRQITKPMMTPSNESHAVLRNALDSGGSGIPDDSPLKMRRPARPYVQPCTTEPAGCDSRCSEAPVFISPVSAAHQPMSTMPTQRKSATLPSSAHAAIRMLYRDRRASCLPGRTEPDRRTKFSRCWRRDSGLQLASSSTAAVSSLAVAERAGTAVSPASSSGGGSPTATGRPRTAGSGRLISRSVDGTGAGERHRRRCRTGRLWWRPLRRRDLGSGDRQGGRDLVE